jgi:hypothetical protein
VFGISRYVSTVAQPDEEAPYPVRTAFQRCLATSTDTFLVRHVEAYVAANPANSKGPMVAVILRAFFDLCRVEIEKERLREHQAKDEPVSLFVLARRGLSFPLRLQADNDSQFWEADGPVQRTVAGPSCRSRKRASRRKN